MKIRVDAILALCIVVMGVSCSSKGASKGVSNIESNLVSESDSLSYIIGMNIAEQLQKMDSTINYSVVCRAILERSQGESLMSDDEARIQYLRYLLYVEPERRRGYEEQFLADLAANDREYTRTKSGLTYHIDVIGNEKLQPKSANDWIVVKYTISGIGGERIYPTVDSVDETIELEGVITDLPLGVEESLKMIGKGGKIRVWVPSKLGYGEDGNEEFGIEPTQTLYYEIELVNVEKGVADKKKKERETF